MFYIKCKKDCSFFGQVFFKDELKTLKEATKWINAQKNIYAEKFLLDNFDAVEVSPKKIFWWFGARYKQDERIF